MQLSSWSGTSDVTISIIDSIQAVVPITPLIFTPENGRTPQIITVIADDDTVAEGSHVSILSHTITTIDPVYAALTAPTVQVNVTDNDTVGVLLVESDGATVVSEAGMLSAFQCLNRRDVDSD
jgi:hypothetical protein